MKKVMHVLDHQHAAPDREAVEAVAATLDLPRGQVEQAGLALWSERVTAQRLRPNRRFHDVYTIG